MATARAQSCDSGRPRRGQDTAPAAPGLPGALLPPDSPQWVRSDAFTWDEEELLHRGSALDVAHAEWASRARTLAYDTRRESPDELGAPAGGPGFLEHPPSRSRNRISLQCQVPGCNQSLTGELCTKHYHQRYRVCTEHASCPSVWINAQPHRFCQKCAVFHTLDAFTGLQRTCARMLAHKMARQRELRSLKKAAKVTATSNSGAAHSDSSGGGVGCDAQPADTPEEAGGAVVAVVTAAALAGEQAGATSICHSLGLDDLCRAPEPEWPAHDPTPQLRVPQQQQQRPVCRAVKQAAGVDPWQFPPQQQQLSMQLVMPPPPPPPKLPPARPPPQQQHQHQPCVDASTAAMVAEVQRHTDYALSLLKQLQQPGMAAPPEAAALQQQLLALQPPAQQQPPPQQQQQPRVLAPPPRPGTSLLGDIAEQMRLTRAARVYSSSLSSMM